MGELSGRRAHMALMAVCALALLAGAFHGNVWFDEAFSVALAEKPMPELLEIAAADVHPPLYYLVLRLVALASGGSLALLRLFSVVGALATAALGCTWVAPRFGRRAGMWFSALAALLPAQAYLADQIRMYSWASCAVTLCVLGALEVRERVGARAWPGLGAWAALALGGLAAAYLHYFGAICAAATNACLLVSFVRAARRDAAPARRALVCQLALAAAQLVAYAPWLAVLVSQTRGVVGGFWIRLSEKDVLRLVAAPLVSEPLEALVGWSRGVGLLVLLAAAMLALLARAALAARCRDARRRRAIVWGLAVYLAPAALGLVAGAVLGTAILYWRYLLVGAGPLCLALALSLSGLSRAPQGACAASLALLAALCQVAFVGAAYDPANRLPEQRVRAAGASVASADVTLLGGLAATCPGARLVLAEWAGGSWSAAYEAFTPALVRGSAPAQTRPAPDEAILWLAGDGGAQAERAAAELGLRVASVERLWRPYDRRHYTLSLLAPAPGATGERGE